MTGLNDDPQGEARYQALSRLPPVPESIPRLVAALYDESWRVRKLASELLARAEATPPLITALLGVLADRGQTGARNAAASALALLGAEAVGPLVTLLGHADADQRKLAADVLGEVRRAEAVPALLGALQDPDLNVQAAAAEALGRIGGHEACRALERLLRSPEALLQVAALEGLTQQGHAPPLPLVAPLLGPAASRRSAYRLLGRVAHPAAFTLLLQGLGTAARDAALAGLGAREAPPGADGDAALGAVARRIDDAHAWLAQALGGEDLAALRGALWVASAWNRAALAPAVATSAQGGVLSEVALGVLARLGLPGARALLGKQGEGLEALGPEARAVAAEAIIRAADPVLVPALTALAEGGEHELQSLAARALGRCRTVDSLPPLLALLESDALSSQAARSLVSLGQTFPAEVSRLLAAVLARRIRPHALRAYTQVAPRSDALAMLGRAIREPAEAVRAATAECAVGLEAAGLPFLTQALSDESALVRRAAVRALARTPPGPAQTLVERALADESPLVLAAAATSAGELGLGACAPRLTSLTTHGESAVALAALVALAELGPVPLEVLERGCAHADPEVAKAALSFAAPHPRVGVLAGGLLTHARWDVRVAAARALAAGAGREALVPLHRALEKESDPMARELLVAAAGTLAER